jgi:hypothetical protein
MINSHSGNGSAPVVSRDKNKAGKRPADTAHGSGNEHHNPDLNPGHVEESSRPGMAGKSGGWGTNVTRKLIVNPIDTQDPGPRVEPNGIKRV